MEREILQAREAIGASVIRRAAQIESAEAHGLFLIACVGPKEIDRTFYCDLRDEALKLEEKSLGAFVRRLLRSDASKEVALIREEMARLAVPKWDDKAPNVVTTVGKNLALDTYLAGSSYTVTGPYIGLISSASWSAVDAADTMSSHAGWLEAGNAHAPTYTAPRKTCAWNPAGSGAKALSAALAFGITGTGTVKGVFVVFGTGAVSTIDNTSGTLYSAGLFSGGDKAVGNGDTINASYTASL